MAELQTRGVLEDNSQMKFHSQQKCCEPSFEPSGEGVLITGHLFNEKYGKLSLNYPCYPFLSTAEPLIAKNNANHNTSTYFFLLNSSLSKSAY